MIQKSNLSETEKYKRLYFSIKKLFVKVAEENKKLRESLKENNNG
jgi:hypothetical protein